MNKIYKITNIDDNTEITLDYVKNILQGNSTNNTYDLTDDYVITQNGVNISTMPTDLENSLIHNNIRYTKYYVCDDCGEYFNYEGDLTEVYNGYNSQIYVCDDCLSNSDAYWQCSHCNDWYTSNMDYYTTQYDDIICEDCRDNYYYYCDRCGELVYEDDLEYCEQCDEHYCNNCYNEYHEYHDHNVLYGYHEFNDWHPTSLANEEPAYYIGHELEIDNGDDIQEAVNSINKINCIPMHDGSLSSKGVEIISHPLSPAYMHSKENEYRQLFDELTNLGYKSHNTTTCGLHFHVTKPQDSTIIDRILLFMETYKDEIILLSRRKSDELNRWSKFLSDRRTSVDSKVIKSLEYIVKNKDTYDRYMALNLTNSKTIEFRFFKGTLKYETFMADFEFIDNLVYYASDLTIPVEKLTWSLITSRGQYLPAYIEEHNLKTRKPIIDYSKELLVIFNENKAQVRIEVDNLIAQLLKNICNKARTKNNTSQKLKKTYDDIYKWNDLIKSLQYTLHMIETMNNLDYGRLDEIKSNITFIKRKVGAE